MDRRTMTVKEAANYLGVHTDTIYTMVKQNEIPHFKMLRKILFLQEALDSWMLAKVAKYQETE